MGEGAVCPWICRRAVFAALRSDARRLGAVIQRGKAAVQRGSSVTQAPGGHSAGCSGRWGASLGRSSGPGGAFSAPRENLQPLIYPSPSGLRLPEQPLKKVIDGLPGWDGRRGVSMDMSQSGLCGAALGRTARGSGHSTRKSGGSEGKLGHSGAGRTLRGAWRSLRTFARTFSTAGRRFVDGRRQRETSIQNFIHLNPSRPRHSRPGKRLRSKRNFPIQQEFLSLCRNEDKEEQKPWSVVRISFLKEDEHDNDSGTFRRQGGILSGAHV